VHLHQPQPDHLSADAGESFSLAEPALVESVLGAAGFDKVGFADVHEPVFYGRNVDSACDVVRSMAMTRDLLAGLDAAAAEAALVRLRALLLDHETADGVVFDSRAWIVTATRG
jgi:hypothetical protein